MEPGYSADSFAVVTGVEHVRRNPAMYVGPVPSPAVVNTLVQEAMCLAVDEAACGHCTEISVTVDPSGQVTVRDNGPGLSMEIRKCGRTVAEFVLTTVFGCRELKRNQRVKASSCGVGITVVNFLSERLRARLFRDGVHWVQDYRFGERQGPFREEGPTTETGLELTFLPDTSLLGPQVFDPQTVIDWFPTTGVRYDRLDRNGGAGGAVMLRFTGLTAAITSETQVGK